MKKIILSIAALFIGLLAVGVASADTVVQSNPAIGESAGIGIVGAPAPVVNQQSAPLTNAIGSPMTQAAVGQWFSIGGWYWYEVRNGVRTPDRYQYVTLQHSRNGGSWSTIGSGYTNSNGYIGWSVREPTAGRYRYRSVNTGYYSSIKTYVVGSSVWASFFASPTVGTRSTNFKFIGSAGGATPKTYYWTFGDGKSAYGKTVYHKYATTGYKTVKLTVKFTNGWSAWMQRSNYIRVR